LEWRIEPIDYLSICLDPVRLHALGVAAADRATVDVVVEAMGVQAKQLVMLERLAQEFELGIRYEERDVSFRLQIFHPDYAALRRYLVDEGLLTRADGVYWRSGGRS